MTSVKHLLWSCAVMTLCSVAHGQSGTQAPMQLDIPAQRVSDALNEFARQSGLQVLIDWEDSREITSPRVSGIFTAEAALDMLLADTGLRYEYLDARTISVRALRPKQADSSDGSAHSATGVHTDLMRFAALAQPESTQPAQSQSGKPEAQGEPEESIQQVIVTAQKREERLQNVPISIAVLSGEDLDSSTVQGTTEVLSRVPGVAVHVDAQTGASQASMRGVAANNTFALGSSPIAYYLDSVPFAMVRSVAAPDADAYDLDRIEVLRGPQGTLYGASALNGVVRILTREPHLDRYEVKLRTGLSNTHGGGENFRGDMALNAPLVQGKLAVRGVIGYQDLSGWIDSPNKADINSAIRRNMRLKLKAQPTEALSIGMSAWISRADHDAPSAGDDNGRTIALLEQPGFTDYDAYSLNIGYERAGISFSSMSSYFDYSTEGHLDRAVVALGDLLQTRVGTETFAQEFLIQSAREGAWRWSVGGMYREGKDRNTQMTPVYFLAPNDANDISESWAVFGEATRLFLAGRLELTTGLRYFKDRVSFRQLSTFDNLPPEQLLRSVDKFDELSPRVVLTWHASERMTGYASYSEGFRSGYGQAAALRIHPGFEPVNPDVLKNYEVGAKGNLLDGRLNFDTAVYYIDWQGVHQPLLVFVPVLSTNIAGTLNGESASGMGVDFALTVTPVKGLELGLNAGWNDLTMDADLISGGIVMYEEGARLSLSAETTFGASVDYSVALGASGYKGRFSASVNSTSERDTRALVAGVRRIASGDSIVIGRAGFSIDSPSGWAATLFVDNFNNEQGATMRRAFDRFLHPYWTARVRPRTIGLQFEYRL